MPFFGVPLRNGVPIGLGSTAGFGTTPFTPAELFYANEPGAWYDPSDLSTLFQDAAGTTPVTAVEQSVGLMLDKSGRNNHASQSTSGFRPTLSARVNLLTQSNELATAPWEVSGITPVKNAIGPDGLTSAWSITDNSAAAFFYVFRQNVALSASVPYVLSVAIKKTTGATSFPSIAVLNATATRRAGCFVNTNTSVATVWTSFTGATILPSSVAVSQVEGVNSDYIRVFLTFTPSASENFLVIITPAATTNITSVGDGEASAQGTKVFWGADLRVANDGVGVPNYQRVTTSTDYYTDNFPFYLRFDGSDDSLATANVDFTSTDSMSLFAGIRRIADGAAMSFVELSASLAANAGTFLFYQDPASGYRFAFTSRGSVIATTPAFTNSTAYNPPVTAVVSAAASISGDSITLRLNGTAATPSTDNQGTGNYGNYPIYIGRRGGTSLPANMRLYSLIIRGAATSASLVTATDAWVNGKTKAYA